MTTVPMRVGDHVSDADGVTWNVVGVDDDARVAIIERMIVDRAMIRLDRIGSSPGLPYRMVPTIPAVED